MCVGGVQTPYQPAVPVDPNTGALLSAMQRQSGPVGGIGNTLLTGGQGAAGAATAMPMATKTLSGG